MGSGAFVSSARPCGLCKADHPLFLCQLCSLCWNCLKPNHTVQECLTGGCRICERIHHVLLHSYDNTGSTTGENLENVDVEIGQQDRTTIRTNGSEVLLSTAIVHISYKNRKLQEVRALLDSGSQSNFISEGLMKRLNLKIEITNITIMGLGQGITNITSSTEARIFL